MVPKIDYLARKSAPMAHFFGAINCEQPILIFVKNIL
jgi:hypothetical protein